MTNKIYKTAMGKAVDLGALILQNEQVRAVGNMGVNARGDLVDGSDRVIDQRNHQVQRQYKRQTNVSNSPVATSNLTAKKSQGPAPSATEPEIDLSSMDPVQSTVNDETTGLAGAMARSRANKKQK